MTNRTLQPQCASPAEWRLQTGKPAKALSPHYRLDCDFGTAVILSWKEGGGEPIYVCGSHAKQLGRSREHFPDAHIVTAQSEQTDNPAKCEDRTQTHKVTEKKSDSSVSVEAASSSADAKSERTQTHEVTGKKSDSSASSEAASSSADAKAERTMIEVRERPSVRDLTYGSSAKALVDEAIWNMAPGNVQAYRSALSQGKSPSEAAEAAGGQLAFIHRKINDYTLKLEAIFSTLQGTISVEETIDKPLDEAMLGIINNVAMSDLEKDAAIEELGTFQKWVKHELQPEMNALQANRILLAIGDRANWGGNSRLSENFKTVYRALYGRLRTALCTAAPEAQNLHDRLTNLYAAKSEMEVP